jgi:hypothetical protein
LLKLLLFLVHAAWIGMRLAGVAPEQALVTIAAFSGWFAVLVWGCVLPTLRRSKVIGGVEYVSPNSSENKNERDHSSRLS